MYSIDLFFKHQIGELPSGELVELTVKVRSTIAVLGEDKEATIEEVLVFTCEQCKHPITLELEFLSPDNFEEIQVAAQKAVNRKAIDILREVA